MVGYSGRRGLPGAELRSMFLRVGSSLRDLGLVRRCSVGFTYGYHRVVPLALLGRGSATGPRHLMPG